jgi:hypothetical protein
VCADGKDLITAAGQNQFFAVGLARYHAAIAEIADRKPISEVGFVRLCCLCHDLAPESISTLQYARCWPSPNRWFGSYYFANCASFFKCKASGFQGNWILVNEL